MNTLHSTPRTAPRRRRAVAALALLFVACSFGSYDTIVPYGKLYVPATATLTVSVDESTLWTVDEAANGTLGQMALKVFDTDSGDVIASKWWSGSWAVRSIAAARESGHEDAAWVLHQNGYRIRWNTDLLGYSEIEVPIPLTGPTQADGRMYCDLDQAADGVQLITTIDFLDGDARTYLYREPAETVWERVELPTLNAKCGRVSWDPVADDVFVLDDNADEMHRFDAGTLAAKGTVDLSAVTGSMADFATIGAHAVIASRIPGPTPDELVIVDPDGAALDTTALARLDAIYIHVVDDTAKAFWTGADSSPIKYTAGSWSLDP